MNDNIMLKKAAEGNINDLVRMRTAYLTEDYGSLTAEQETALREVLPRYFEEHLNKDLIAYLAETESGEVVACCFLLVCEKPANPSFMRGRTGSVMNVYTMPAHRRKGIAKRLMQNLISDAHELQLDFVELKATEDGYHLYKSLGFEEVQSEYRSMKLNTTPRSQRSEA